MDQRRPVREQPVHGCLEVRHLHCKADLPADALACLELVDRLCLCLVEDLQGGAANVEYERLSLAVIQDGGRLEAEPVAVELHRARVILGRERDAQFEDRLICIGWGHGFIHSFRH